LTLVRIARFLAGRVTRADGMSHAAEMGGWRGETAGQAAQGWTLRILEDWREAEPRWQRMMESGAASPYQTFAFQMAWAEQSAAIDGSRCVLVEARNQAGEAAMLLPLAIQKNGPLRIARYLGGKHVNLNLPVAAPGALPADAASLRRLLREIGRSCGADALMLVNQPITWLGRPHPFAPLGGQPSPSFAYKFTMPGDIETFFESRLSNDARYKLRRREKKLEALGPLRYFSASNPSEARLILEAFLDQKRKRFAAQGIADAFAEPGIDEFMRHATCEIACSGAPAIRLYAMAVGERIIATYGGVVDQNRFSGMFTSFDASEDVYRWSPGEHLLIWLIREQARLGVAAFDLGIGQARYKAAYCDEEEPLFDLAVPVTAKGRVAMVAGNAALAAKRRLKNSRRFMAALGAVRKWRAKPRP
jgi:CelD/BcsL family acetyltransferase involved in cellulose biosynthesis